ncbi:LysM peptidoglycan-binding domain-containing protein [Anaerosolibacter sp.]|uniref:LysM peptidoglycan-binding domain-containing protein n=1 Tax=Anaerosolibacter sp. TaxID=1872527 RepID=UPI0039EEE116
MEIYTVVSGDSLWRIAQRFGVTIEAIAEVNGINPQQSLIIGMNLVIPTGEKMNMMEYTVRPGDTLWSIGQRFGVDYLEIARINNIDQPYPLTVGQRIQIPALGEVYIVKAGDSLWSIAQRFNTSINNLIAWNNLAYPYSLFLGQRLFVRVQRVAPTEEKITVEILGYYNPTAVQDKTFIINTLGDYLTYLGIFEFPFTETGEVIGTIDDEILEAARNKNVAVLPVLTNIIRGNFSSELGRTVLSQETLRNNLINNIMDLLQRYNLIGIIIDIENLYPEDRGIFTEFIRILSDTLHRNNKILILNMPAKWEEWAEREWVGFFDYNALGPMIDIAAIMTYEWGWQSGPPRATAPLEYVQRALDYALNNNIPRNKIQVGLTLYGYDWELPDTPENLARTVTLPMVWDLARTYGASISFDNNVKQPYMNYVDSQGKAHIVWFEDALSHYHKYQLLKEYQLLGAFYWILNLPFQATWYILSHLFDIKKL